MSVVTPDNPGALLFFIFFRASLTSASDGGLSRVEVIGLWSIWSLTVGSISVFTVNNFTPIIFASWGPVPNRGQ